MVAFNFSPEFAEIVKSGKKFQTIRQSVRCKVGDRLQLYTGQRTKGCVKLGDAICTGVHKVSISETIFTFNGEEQSRHMRNIYAQKDGFKDYDEMYRWFLKKYGYNYFTGFCVEWKKPDSKVQEPK